MSKRYLANTVIEMSQIPDEALPRFIAELPDMLKQVRQMKAGMGKVAEEAKKAAPWPLSWLPVSWIERSLRRQLEDSLYWIDDDKGTVTLSVSKGEGDDPFYQVSGPLKQA